MLPVLIDLPFLKIYTFGVFLLLAFFWGAFLLWKNFLLTSYKEEDVFDHLFFGITGGLVVSRAVYVALHFNDFGLSISKFILINGYPGLSLYGFIFGFLGATYFAMGRGKIKFLDAIDYFVPSGFIAMGFAKIGAFFSGVEIGSKTNFLLKLKYVGADGMRHLTPLYEGILFFIGALVAYKILFSIRRERFSKGTNLYFFLWFTSAVLALLDMLKASDVSVFNMFSFNALVSYILLLTFSSYFVYYFRSSISKFFVKYGKNIFKRVHKKAQEPSRKG